MKLQQAYFSEANQAGGWQLIGYMAPGNNSSTTNFNYTPGDLGPKESSDLADAVKAWAASNTANLNECKAGENWTVKLSKVTGDTQTDITFTASAGTAGCVALTPTFDKIGK
ncbi:hypothetical protein SAMN05720470_12121 [Fibrobacter sp. UWOV1]|uniref:hypothetical protein n=1 Tax=Fibrobacter sp. UWOV1 TaxID=1896215 RepID=UPI000912B207|nr:hypothetical protein [Fibrobacter sp. UWOV1]SHL87733.1 hypothetical protein SAMN05720470_12121 [Fibrobacter sp. UWOV1]